MYKRRRPDGDYIRSAFFGVEDSLVSTTGLIAGVAAATSEKSFILLAGIVAVAVEAISMAAGEFLAEETEHDLDKNDRAKPLIGGLIMLVSYALAGLVPILPAALLPHSIAIYWSIGLAMVGLFCLGIIKGKITNQPMLGSGLKVFLVGGTATAIGVCVGILFKIV